MVTCSVITSSSAVSWGYSHKHNTTSKCVSVSSKTANTTQAGKCVSVSSKTANTTQPVSVSQLGVQRQTQLVSVSQLGVQWQTQNNQ